MSRRALVCVVLVAALGGCRSKEKSQAKPAARHDAAPPAGPRLAVLIIIDQLPTWSFDRSLPHLSGGFARLAREGVHYTRVEIPYSNTFTASGHAAIATGAPPRDTGIVANEWHHNSAATTSGVTDDPASPLLGPLQRPGGESSRALKLDGVADVLERVTGGRARTVALGLKDRSAILAIGKKPDVVVWWDTEQKIMTTSRFYADERPAWLDPAAGMVSDPAALVQATWEPKDAEACAALTGSTDDSPGEGGNHGLGKTFPHSLTKVENPGKAFLNTPFATQLLLETAAAAIKAEKLGADEVPDLLSISISSHDYAGHGWGQESWECADVLLDIDRRLGVLFELLDETVGADRWVAIVTTDHGALPVASARTGPDGAPTHVIPKLAVVGVAEAAARKALGARGPWMVPTGLSGNLLHMGDKLRALPEARREVAIAAIVKAVAAIPGMGVVERTSTLIGDCDRYEDPHRQRACLSLPPGMVEAIYALPLPRSQYIGDHPWGAGHGGGSEEERIVPVLVRVPGRAAARVDEPVSFLRVAPTLAALLGIEPPPSAKAPPLD